MVRRAVEAVATWREALEAVYTDAAGGVEVPAFLLFAAVKLGDPKLEKEATAILRKRWKPRLKKIWPGPIAGYLLGKMNGEDFLVNQTFLDPILEARRLCRAHFWVGVQELRQGHEGRYLVQLRRAISDPAPAKSMVILESEYWLACAELESRSKRSFPPHSRNPRSR